MGHGVHSAISLRDVVQACDIRLICLCHMSRHCNVHTRPGSTFYEVCELSFPGQYHTDKVLLFCGTRCAESGPCPHCIKFNFHTVYVSLF
jgi:hypothetical protein